VNVPQLVDFVLAVAGGKECDLRPCVRFLFH
jgi:hypothetical protein